MAPLRACLALVLVAPMLLAVEQSPGEELPREPAPGYRLYPGDLISISVFDHPDLKAQLRVPVDGTLTFPLIGEVDNVVGQPMEAVVRRVQARLEADYVRQAVITATVLELGPRRAVVMGSVVHPDAVELSPYAPTTAMQAVGQTGGFTKDANRAAAVVIRDDPGRPGRKVAIGVPAADDPEALIDDVVLQPRDIVIVPRLDRVYIIGEVGQPGALNLPSQEALTVSKAISLAGGFAKFARESEVQLIRGDEPIRTVDVRAILSGKDGAEDLTLRPGDTVYVPESSF